MFLSVIKKRTSVALESKHFCVRYKPLFAATTLYMFSNKSITRVPSVSQGLACERITAITTNPQGDNLWDSDPSET